MTTADTNVSSPERPLTDAPRASATLARERALTTLQVLIRREFWEHRALWMAPLVTSVLLIACAFPAHIDFSDFTRASSDGRFRDIAWFAALQWGLTTLQFLIAAIVVNFYLLDCLFAERKDRSILFWKSLPASDGATVLSKLLVAQAVVPLGVYLLSIPTALLFSLVWMVRASLGHLPAAVAMWDTVAWLKVEVIVLFTGVVAALWYVPLSAYLLLVSAWARRSVFLWATLPPVLAIVLEHVAFGTRYVWSLIAYRTGGIFDYVHIQKIIEGTILSAGSGHPISLGAASAELARAFGNIDLWIGLAVGAALTYAAARIRRYRDDT
ncbi:MAG TPA: hypothetical protein VFO44_01660 [Steroidobacteraceae bacterium]|nr:hypothetical protein [Steroidobacteraceae bacterium]